jgi:hypothetical protein
MHSTRYISRAGIPHQEMEAPSFPPVPAPHKLRPLAFPQPSHLSSNSSFNPLLPPPDDTSRRIHAASSYLRGTHLLALTLLFFRAVLAALQQLIRTTMIHPV